MRSDQNDSGNRVIFRIRLARGIRCRALCEYGRGRRSSSKRNLRRWPHLFESHAFTARRLFYSLFNASIGFIAAARRAGRWPNRTPMPIDARYAVDKLVARRSKAGRCWWLGFEGLALAERRNAFGFFRDPLAELLRDRDQPVRRPRSGSSQHRALTATTIDCRDFLNAETLFETQGCCPPGPRIAFAGGADCTATIIVTSGILDTARAERPDMVLRTEPVRGAQSGSPMSGRQPQRFSGRFQARLIDEGSVRQA
jgi:hypothetical protein